MERLIWIDGCKYGRMNRCVNATTSWTEGRKKRAEGRKEGRAERWMDG